MKKVLLFCMILGFTKISAQEWSLGVGYQYLFSEKWDKAIQTFNFSRPFLEEKQPLLKNGTYAELNYLFKSDSRLQSGIKVEHSFIRSRSENENFKLSIHLQELSLAYSLRYSLQNNQEGIFLELTPSVFGTRLSRRVNKELDQIDDENNVAFGIGGNIGLTGFYQIELRSKYKLMPFIGGSYSPYLYSPKSVAVLQQVTIDEAIQIIRWKIGFRVVLKE